MISYGDIQWDQETHQLAEHQQIVLTNQQINEFSRLCITVTAQSFATARYVFAKRLGFLIGF